MEVRGKSTWSFYMPKADIVWLQVSTMPAICLPLPVQTTTRLLLDYELTYGTGIRASDMPSPIAQPNDDVGRVITRHTSLDKAFMRRACCLLTQLTPPPRIQLAAILKVMPLFRSPPHTSTLKPYPCCHELPVPSQTPY